MELIAGLIDPIKLSRAQKMLHLNSTEKRILDLLQDYPGESFSNTDIYVCLRTLDRDAISNVLSGLKAKGLICRKRQGKYIINYLNMERIRALMGTLKKFNEPY